MSTLDGPEITLILTVIHKIYGMISHVSVWGSRLFTGAGDTAWWHLPTLLEVVAQQHLKTVATTVVIVFIARKIRSSTFAFSEHCKQRAIRKEQPSSLHGHDGGVFAGCSATQF